VSIGLGIVAVVLAQTLKGKKSNDNAGSAETDILKLCASIGCTIMFSGQSLARWIE
jgi:hypothetical protein